MKRKIAYIIIILATTSVSLFARVPEISIPKNTLVEIYIKSKPDDKPLVGIIKSHDSKWIVFDLRDTMLIKKQDDGTFDQVEVWKKCWISLSEVSYIKTYKPFESKKFKLPALSLGKD